MSSIRPKFITFDCYGTLINFEMGPATRRAFAGRMPAEQMDRFCADFSAFRLDEVLGAWKPYQEVVGTALERTCKLWRIPFDPAAADRIYAEIPSWSPHADVPPALARVARHYPLVVLSNSMTALIPFSVAKIGAPFHASYTAEEARAYKPRMKAFEYMLDGLGCAPEDVLHCSSSYRYDLMTAHDMRFGYRIFVNRGHEPANPFYGAGEVQDIGELPSILGL